MAQKHRDNFITPLRTLGLSIGITEMDPLAHTAIFGDDNAEPSVMLKALVEQDMSKNRKVISVSFNSSYAVLATGSAFLVDLTRDNIQFQIDPQQADILARLVVASSHSFAIDVGGLEPGDAATIVERIAAHLSIQKTLVAATTLAVDLTDTLTPKRRMGLDANAVQQMNSLLGRGYTLGARILMAARAPSEIPLEYARGTVQTIITRATGASVVSIGKHVGHQGRIVTNATVPGVGIASIEQGDFWLFDMTDDVFGPYLIDTTNNAGHSDTADNNAGKRQSATKAFGKEYEAAVAKAKKDRENAKIDKMVEARLQRLLANEKAAQKLAVIVKARGGRKTRDKAVVAAPTNACPSASDVIRALQALGANRPACRGSAITTLAKMRNMTMTLDDAVEVARSDTASRAICFGEMLYRNGIMSKGSASALGYVFLTENAKHVDAFRDRLVARNGSDKVGAAAAWLGQADTSVMPLTSDKRIQTLTRAWRNHLAQAVMPVAANDQGAAAIAA